MAVFTLDRFQMRFWPLAAVLVLLCVAPSLRAQDGTGIFEEELRVRLDRQRPDRRDAPFEAGGWLSATYYDYNDAGARRNRALRQLQLRLWGQMNIDGVHRAYVRGLLNYDDWDRGDNPVYNRGDEAEHEIERAWYKLVLGQDPAGSRAAMTVKAGRQFTTIGTAFAMSMPLDAVQIEANATDVSLKGLLGLTIRDSYNIDSTDNVSRHQDRLFAGIEAAYEGFDRHRPFIYFLSNDDRTKPHPAAAGQSFEYSSQYLGIGSRGALPGGELKYQTELVGQWGKTYSEGATSGKDRIRAMAIDVGVDYTFRVATKPKLMAEYIYASGDKDRRYSTTSTAGGNLAGSKDHAFNAFGFRDTGLAYSPRISNLHMMMVGGSCFPLENIELFEKMEVGTKFFCYHKADEAGPVSDTTAPNDSRFLGSASDVFIDWRLTSDLSWTVRCGAFFPGSAYDGGDKTCRQFVYSGLVLSF